MKLSQIIPESVFGTIGTIKDENSIQIDGAIMIVNKHILDRFKNVIISLNSAPGVSAEVVSDYKIKCQEILPNAIILYSQHNRGHMFGTIDLEESILIYLKHNFLDVKYLWKSMNDVMIGSGILEREYKEAGFYYLPGFSYESIAISNKQHNIKTDEDYVKFYKSVVKHPQTTLFIADVTSVSRLYGWGFLDLSGSYFRQKEENPSLKPWEISTEGYNIDKFDCEHMIGETLSHLSNECLITDDEFMNLINLVDQNKIADPSHKNIMFKEIGVCHFHDTSSGVYMI